MDFQGQIIKALKERYRFKKTGGNWMQAGECPECGKWELFCAANEPKIIRCSRSEKCGFEDSVRNVLPDLFEDWSKRFEATEAEPNAAADAYLSHERGIDLQGLRGSYTQEIYKDFNSGATGATVRFKLPNDTYWERIIDKPGRFGKKAHFQKGGSWNGHCWMHPQDDFAALAAMDEIWIAEGIFDSLALRAAFAGRETNRAAVSAMSVNVFPEKFFAELQKAIIDGPTPKKKPEIVFAFDVGAAGVRYTKKFVEQLSDEGWETKAAQVRPDGEGTKLDWNDLWLRHRDWSGEEEKSPLGEVAISEFLYNGAITVAATARDKAKLIMAHKLENGRASYRSFEFRHNNQLWWAKMSSETEDQAGTLIVTEIANCAFNILYRERDEILDETSYFIRIDFPFNQKTEKARFSAAACATSAEFKKRLFAFAGIWAGTAEQLDRIMRIQTRNIKTVEPINFTGYSAQHKAWVLGDIAVRDGKVISQNRENYFDLGRDAVKRRSNQNLLEITYDPDKLQFDWLADIWTAWGPKGLIAFAFFCMSGFAVQIRERHKSLGFLEITGEAGSGKSTLIEAIWRSFGRFGYEGLDPNKGTVPYLARSMMGVSNLPVGLIEGNREQDRGNHGRKFDWNELLTLYNGRSPRGTGVKSSGNEVSEPPFLGSIYLMQNDPIDAMPAVLERIMSMRIDKANWSDETSAAAIRMERMPMEVMSGTLVHIIRQEADFLRFFFEQFEHHNKTMRSRVAGLTNARCIKCHSQLAAAVEALPNMFPVIKPEWMSATLAEIDKMALARQLSSGGDHPTVADFWEKVDYILRGEDDDRHEKGTSINKHRKPDQYIAINLPHFEAATQKAQLRTPDMDQLKRLLRNSQSRKFIETKNINAPGNKVFSCWVFEQPNQAERII